MAHKMAVFRVFLRILPVAVLLQAGCVGHVQYRPVGRGNVTEHATEDGSAGYKLTFIEFDDQGEMWDPRQLRDALKVIRDENAATKGGVITVVFIHGWKNDASPRIEEKGNLHQFKKVLEQVALEEQGKGRRFPSRIADTKPRRVVGVYIAWRGKCMYSPGLDTVSFFTRRAAANRVGSISLEESLLRVMHEAKRKASSKCVVVGYSFGGAILEKAIAQAMVPLMVYAHEDGIRIPADVIVVANPASDATLAKQFIEILDRGQARLVFKDKWGKETGVDGPLLASITSRADWVTRGAFPFGMYVNNALRRFRAYPDLDVWQRTLASRTAGHVSILHSHAVDEDAEGRPVLRRLEGAWNNSPYWIMSVPGSVVPAHNQIFGEKFVDLLIQLMNRNMIFSPEVELLLRTSDDLVFRDPPAVPAGGPKRVPPPAGRAGRPSAGP